MSSFNATAIVLQNATENFVEYRLTGGYIIDGLNLPIVQVQLTDTDRDAIKSLLTLATRPASTLLRLDSDIIEDMNSNPAVTIAPSEALKASTYTDDMQAPQFIGFALNLNTSELFLTFSETVDASTLDVTGITILDDRSPNATMVQLTPTRASQEDSIYVTVFLNREDTNKIKRFVSLGTSVNNTFISIDATTIRDVDGNFVVAVTVEEAIPAREVTSDDRPPVLEAFSFDVNTGQLLLTFDETVNASSVDPTQITIQNDVIRRDYFTLTGGTVISDNDNIVTIQLTRDDQNALKEITTLAVSENDTFVSLTEFTVADLSGNYVVQVENISAQRVADGGYMKDMTRPDLESFELDLDSAELTLYFSETVNVDSFKIDTITIQGSILDATDSYTLTVGSLSLNNSDTIIVYLSDFDLNMIKVDRNIATDLNNTVLTLMADTVHDMALMPNYVNPVSQDAANFTADTTSPQITIWLVNINQSQLTINFNEPVERDSLSFQAITLQQNESNATEYFTLTGGSSASNDGEQMVITISEEDLNVIKQMLMLLRDLDTSYLSFNSSFIQDMNGNPIVDVPVYNALQAFAYYNDSTSPHLRDYYLDMDTGVITFSFSETVNASSIQFPGIILQNQLNITDPGGLFYPLTSGTVLSDNGPVIQLLISRTDLNELKRLEIVRNPRTTWLSLDSIAVSDIDGNPVMPLENGLTARGIARVNYIFDTSGPVLEAFDLDLTGEILTIFQ